MGITFGIMFLDINRLSWKYKLGIGILILIVIILGIIWIRNVYLNKCKNILKNQDKIIHHQTTLIV